MKKILTLFFLVAPCIMFSQIPQAFNYQAVVRNSSGQILFNTDADFLIEILQDGSSIYSEEHSRNSGETGVVNFKIGQGINPSSDFSQINWGSGQLQIQITLNDEPSPIGIADIVAVPFALYAQSSADNYWSKSGPDIYYNEGRVGIGVSDPSNPLEVIGSIRVTGDNTGGKFHMIANNPGQNNWIRSDDENLNTMWRLTMGDRANNDNLIIDRPDNGIADFVISPSGKVGIGIDSPEGTLDVRSFVVPANTSATYASIAVSPRNSGTLSRSVMASGYSWSNIYTRNFDGDFLTYMGGAGTEFLPAENGIFSVLYDDEVVAQMYSDQGTGVIQADIKNFKIQHPQFEQKEIWYACIEGPEAAAYERGTGVLKDGYARIEFSEHFKHVINPSSMTVQITPLSSNTFGLAVIKKDENGFVVKELMNGNGNFKFDWEAKCVRKGYEDYEVIRNKQKRLYLKGEE